ncbi:MAG: MaoC family dehydratase [Ilumatobacteraceae bacterium]
MNAPKPIAVGDQVPPWTMASVDAARMKTMAALLRDPYPVHWDRVGNAGLGIGHRVINQGPLNVGYLVNMLIAWAGPSSVRRLTLAFGRPVLDGDHLTARGVVTDLDGQRMATCDVWLDRDGEHVVTGTAVVDVTTAPRAGWPS